MGGRAALWVGSGQSPGTDSARLSKTDSGGGINGTENYSYNNANMLLARGSNNYTNDTAGNTLTGGGRTNAWDAEHRLTQCVYNGATSQFKDSADGIRHRSVVGGTTTDFVTDASMFVREQRGGTNYATYLVGMRGPEYRRDDTAGTVSWYIFDGLGSVLGEVSPSGTVTAFRKYDVYGGVRSGGSGTSSQKFVGALGHPSDDNTGLIYMQARYMDPVCGRFESEDPAHQHANWFNYASCNPVWRIDRSGRDDGNLAEVMSEMSMELGLGELEEACGLAELEGEIGVSGGNLNVFIEYIESSGGPGSATFNKSAFLNILNAIARDEECTGINIVGQTSGDLSGGEKLFKAFEAIVKGLGDNGYLTLDDDITTLYWLMAD